MEFIQDSNSLDSKDFVKLKDGEWVIGVFRGSLYEFKQHWLESEKRSVECPGTGCVHCEAKLKPGFRFRVNMVVKDNSVYSAKLFEQGWKVYQQMRALNEEHPLEKIFVKVTRSGKGNDTTYSIIPSRDGAINSQTEKMLEGVKLLDTVVLKKIEADADIPF